MTMLEHTPAYQYMMSFLDVKFPTQDEKWKKEAALQWFGLMRSVRFQKWVEEQDQLLNTCETE